MCQRLLKHFTSTNSESYYFLFFKNNIAILLLADQAIFVNLAPKLFLVAVPELQGEPEDVAREKCKIATQTVNNDSWRALYM